MLLKDVKLLRRNDNIPERLCNPVNIDWHFQRQKLANNFFQRIDSWWLRIKVTSSLATANIFTTDAGGNAR